MLAEGVQDPGMDHHGSRLQSTAAMHRSAPGAPAIAEFAVPALSLKRPRIAKRKTILKQVAAMAVLHGIMPLVDGLKPDDMLAFSSPPVDEVFPS